MQTLLIFALLYPTSSVAAVMITIATRGRCPTQNIHMIVSQRHMFHIRDNPVAFDSSFTPKDTRFTLKTIQWPLTAASLPKNIRTKLILIIEYICFKGFSRFASTTRHQGLCLCWVLVFFLRIYGINTDARYRNHWLQPWSNSINIFRRLLVPWWFTYLKSLPSSVSKHTKGGGVCHHIKTKMWRWV